VPHNELRVSAAQPMQKLRWMNAGAVGCGYGIFSGGPERRGSD
jgi:hypothetical protein